MLSPINLVELIDQCRYETNLDVQINMLYHLNESLPEHLRIKIPSLLTNDYIGRALDIIEDKVIDYEHGVGPPVSTFS